MKKLQRLHTLNKMSPRALLRRTMGVMETSIAQLEEKGREFKKKKAMKAGERDVYKYEDLVPWMYTERDYANMCHLAQTLAKLAVQADKDDKEIAEQLKGLPDEEIEKRLRSHANLRKPAPDTRQPKQEPPEEEENAQAEPGSPPDVHPQVAVADAN